MGRGKTIALAAMILGTGCQAATEPEPAKAESELRLCKPNTNGGCPEGCGQFQPYIVGTLAEGCRVERLEDAAPMCNWWLISPPDDQAWNGAKTIWYRRGVAATEFLVMANDMSYPRANQTHINEWISCQDVSITDHPAICGTCSASSLTPSDELIDAGR